jgi:hypothetical protein
MTYLIAVTDSPAIDDLSIERSVLTDMQVEKVSWQDEKSLIAALRDAHAILCMHAHINQAVISSLRHCKVITRFGTGLDNIDRKAASEAGIPVIGIQDYCTQEVADHTLALLPAWNCKVIEYHQFVIKKRWNERKQTTGNWGCGPLYSLRGRTFGLLGFGHIGRAVAQRARLRDERVQLSGGNQQKVVLAKWLANTPSLLILNGPTRGVDVGAKREVHTTIKELAHAGITVLLWSSDAAETLEVTDRILVMSKGRLTREFNPRTTSLNQLLLAVFGESDDAVRAD